MLVFKTWQGSPTRCRTRATHLTSLGGASGRDPGGSLQSAQFQQHLAPGTLQDHSTHVDAHKSLALWAVFLLISSQTHFHILSRTFTYMQRPDSTTRHLIQRAWLKPTPSSWTPQGGYNQTTKAQCNLIQANISHNYGDSFCPFQNNIIVEAFSHSQKWLLK